MNTQTNSAALPRMSCSQSLRLYTALIHDVSEGSPKESWRQRSWWKHVAAKSKKHAKELLVSHYEYKIDVTVYRAPLTGEREEWIICPANATAQTPPDDGTKNL